MALIGYARVSTDTQDTAAQEQALRAAGCDGVHLEQASGGDRARPVLRAVLRDLRVGDTLVVVRLDRLARSLSHLLDVIEGLEKRGAHFRSLSDPVDTASPQGKFTLQVLGAAAELERALIRERTKAGLAEARRHGRIGGNPGLRAGDARARAKIAAARKAAYLDGLIQSAPTWVPLVRRMRPHTPWEDIARALSARDPSAPWSVPRLRRAAGALVHEGMLSASVMGRAPVRAPDDRLLAIVAGIKGADPTMTLQAIADRLEAMRERTPRGAVKWQVSSVKMILDRVRDQGLLKGGTE